MPQDLRHNIRADILMHMQKHTETLTTDPTKNVPKQTGQKDGRRSSQQSSMGHDFPFPISHDVLEKILGSQVTKKIIDLHKWLVLDGHVEHMVGRQGFIATFWQLESYLFMKRVM